jgi:hypothetical protein
MNYCNNIAALCAQAFDAVSGASTLFTKYEKVLEYDAKLRLVITENIPVWLDSREPVEPHWPIWVPWARRSFNLCGYHKIMMIHREFLGRSFREPAFEYSRHASLAAAKSILREAKQAYDEEGPSFWIDQAFMVAAGIVLSLDIFHRREHEPELEEHRKLADTTVNLLGKFENSAIGQRGAKLLSSLLTEQARMHANTALESYRTSSRHGLENGGGGDDPARKRQKFDVPKFVGRFIGDDSFTGCLRAPERNLNSEQLQPFPLPTTVPSTSGTMSSNQNSSDQNPNQTQTQDGQVQSPIFNINQFDDANTAVPRLATPSLETFEQLFPPQTGINNSFLFEDLLNFDF